MTKANKMREGMQITPGLSKAKLLYPRLETQRSHMNVGSLFHFRGYGGWAPGY